MSRNRIVDRDDELVLACECCGQFLGSPHLPDCQLPQPMATTEAGGGVPSGDELRERLVQSVWLRYNRVICDELTSVFGEPVVTDDEIMASWGNFEADQDEEDQGDFRRIVGYCLAEIAAAGFKIVPDDAIVLVPCEDEVLMPDFDPDQYDLDRPEGWE
jgi:hypothetical protein